MNIPKTWSNFSYSRVVFVGLLVTWKDRYNSERSLLIIFILSYPQLLYFNVWELLDQNPLWLKITIPIENRDWISGYLTAFNWKLINLDNWREFSHKKISDVTEMATLSNGIERIWFLIHILVWIEGVTYMLWFNYTMQAWILHSVYIKKEAAWITVYEWPPAKLLWKVEK